ncbi:tetratricopeptide repeat protein [candidate division FCPU426 bacterium]|nr:tetratricopeptide repeat protein [candidate division FCPU426 bacterium]
MRTSFPHLLWILPLLLTLSGCNLFATMHSDGKESNSHVLVADGKAAISRGDYVKAAEYFRLACEHNPRDSEARMGYAEAYLRAQGFSLGEFMNTLLSTLDQDSGSNEVVELIHPADWGVSSMAEVEQILATLVFTLDPIALGQTDGPYRFDDVNVNLTAGLFYALKVAARMQTLAGTFSIQMFDKDSAEVAAWGLSASVLNQLSQEFLWLADSGGNQPLPSFIISIQNDVHAAVARLRVAAANSKAEDTINDILDLFADWDILAYQ